MTDVFWCLHILNLGISKQPLHYKMIKLMPAETGNFHNFKCGEVYCLSTTRYNITCCLCGTKVELIKFPLHFQDHHLSSESKALESPRSPIGTRARRKTQTHDDPLFSSETIAGIKPEEEISAFSWNDNFDDEMPIDMDVITNIDVEKKTENNSTDLLEMGAETDMFCGEDDDDINIGIESHEWLHEKYSYKNVPSEEDDLNELEELAISDVKVSLYANESENDDTEHFLNTPKNKNCLKEIPTDYIVQAVQCEHCNRLFNSKIGLKIHTKALHERKDSSSVKPKSTPKPPQDYQCEQCGDKFVTERNLITHRYKHTGIFCEVCGKKFSQIGNMERHRIRHTGVKTVECEHCDMKFFTAREKKAHMMRHTGILPIICEICGKRCRDHGVLTAHMRRHTGERPAKCNVCGKSFFSGYDLNVHSVTHTTERPFKCEICGSTFQLKKSLRVHKKIHSKDRNYLCKLCGKSFIQQNGLQAHMLAIHDTDESNKFFETGDSTDVTEVAVEASNAALVDVAVANDGSMHWSLGII